MPFQSLYGPSFHPWATSKTTFKEENSTSHINKSLTRWKGELFFSRAWPQHTLVLMRLLKLSDYEFRLPGFDSSFPNRGKADGLTRLFGSLHFFFVLLFHMVVTTEALDMKCSPMGASLVIIVPASRWSWSPAWEGLITHSTRSQGQLRCKLSCKAVWTLKAFWEVPILSQDSLG